MGKKRRGSLQKDVSSSAPQSPDESEREVWNTYLSIVYVPSARHACACYCYGLPKDITEAELKAHCEGEAESEGSKLAVKNIGIRPFPINCQDSKQLKSCAVVEFDSHSSCDKFLKGIHKMKRHTYLAVPYAPPVMLDEDLRFQLYSGKVFWCGHTTTGIPVLWAYPKHHITSTVQSETLELHLRYLCDRRRILQLPVPVPDNGSEDEFQDIDNSSEMSPKSKFCLVIDFAGLGMKNYNLAQVKIVIKLAEELLAPDLEAMYFFNTPLVFWALWKVVKKFISPELASKISILGKDYRKVLGELIPADKLPSTVGGLVEITGEEWIYGYPEDLLLADLK